PAALDAAALRNQGLQRHVAGGNVSAVGRGNPGREHGDGGGLGSGRPRDRRGRRGGRRVGGRRGLRRGRAPGGGRGGGSVPAARGEGNQDERGEGKAA